MAKTLSDTVLDGLLNILVLNVDRIGICSAQPTTYAECTSTFMLALATVVVGDTNQFTLANGAVDGRKITSAAIASTVITNSGTATHIGFAKSSGTVFYGANTLTASTALTATNYVALATFTITVRDPT